MDPSAYMQYSSAFGVNSSSMNNGQMSQGGKNYMNQQSFPPQSQSAYSSMQDLNKGLLALNLDSKTLKKLSQSGIKEFIPQQPIQMKNTDLQQSSRFQTSHQQQPPRPLRHPSGPPFPNYQGDRLSASSLNTPPPSMLGSSPRQSPTPVSIGTVSGNNSVTPTSDQASNIGIYNEGGTTYFISGNEMSMGDPSISGVSGRNQNPAAMIPNFSVYFESPNSLAANKAQLHTPKQMAKSEFKMELLKRQYICLAELDPESVSEAVPTVENFLNLVPLEPIQQMPTHKSNSFGYQSSVYKGVNAMNGAHVCLRRIHGFRLVHTKCMALVDQWKKLQHTNVVPLRQVFTSKDFGDHSIVFVYDLYPGAETLMSKYLSNSSQIGSAFVDPFSGLSDGARPFSQQKNQIMRAQAMMNHTGFLPESLLWNFIIQLTAALRHIHSASLACRVLDPSKVLITSGPSPRLLLNCCGIADVLNFDVSCTNPMAAIAHYQQEDLIALGKIVLALACQNITAVQRENLQTSIEVASSTYSKDLRSLLLYLLTSPARLKSVNDLMPMIGARFYSQLDAANSLQDSLELEFSREIESSRLFRVLTKLCTVVDRAELNGDHSWSEYGDCYMLKLFHDYVFHQVMDDNRPWLDMAHVVSNLNKLDAGVSDKICLMSRDEQNVLVVSYTELKRCLEQAFGECVHYSKAVPAV